MSNKLIKIHGSRLEIISLVVIGFFKNISPLLHKTTLPVVNC